MISSPRSTSAQATRKGQSRIKYLIALPLKACSFYEQVLVCVLRLHSEKAEKSHGSVTTNFRFVNERWQVQNIELFCILR